VHTIFLATIFLTIIFYLASTDARNVHFTPDLLWSRWMVCPIMCSLPLALFLSFLRERAVACFCDVGCGSITTPAPHCALTQTMLNYTCTRHCIHDSDSILCMCRKTPTPIRAVMTSLAVIVFFSHSHPAFHFPVHHVLNCFG
jgi:hypothetical protein